MKVILVRDKFKHIEASCVANDWEVTEFVARTKTLINSDFEVVIISPDTPDDFFTTVEIDVMYSYKDNEK